MTSTGRPIVLEPSMSMPAGRHYAATYAIPPDFGGMTAALLKRSAAIVRVTGQPVDVLTFDQADDHGEVSGRLTRRGLLEPGVRIVNIWDHLATLNDRQLEGRRRWSSLTDRLTRAAKGPRDSPLAIQRRAVGPGDSTEFVRADGSVVVRIDRSKHPESGKPRRTITVLDHEGTSVGRWTRAAEFYQWWLDILMSPSESHWLIIDSKTLAPSLASYRRPHVHRFHLVHNLHLRTQDPPPYGHLSRFRSYLGLHVNAFDGTVFLTEQQKRDAELLLGTGTNRHAIANSCPLLASIELDRSRRSGVMLAKLSRRKRVDHAMQAVAALKESAPDSAPEITVYGDGVERGPLDQLREELDLGTHFELAGYHPHAAASFETASFSLLTSTYEGLPLVLVESMGAGCIPIAYDVPYGPAQMIEHGRTGFLVPAGDTEALAERMREIVHMPDSKLQEMRHAARSRAEDFTEQAIIGQWAAAFQSLPTKKSESSTWTATLSEVGVRVSSTSSELTAVVSVEELTRHQRRTGPRFSVVYRNRNDVFVRSTVVETQQTSGSAWTIAASLPADNARWLSDETVELNVEVLVGTENRLLRIPAPKHLPRSVDPSDVPYGFYRAKNGATRLRFADRGDHSGNTTAGPT